MKLLKALVLFLAIFTLVSCSQKPKPEDTFQAYMKAWENQDYEQMYSLLSDGSKEAVSLEDFKEKYKASYEEINMDELGISYELPEEEQEYDKEETPTFDYKAEMNSIAGKIEFSHKAALVYQEGEEEDKWLVDWNPSMIFPGMEEGDRVQATTLIPERGEIFDQDGKGLAINGVIQEVGLVPEWMAEAEEDQEKTKEKLAKILDISVATINQKLDQEWVKPDSFVPLASVADNDEEKIAAIKELQGYKFNEKSARVYPLGKAAAHLTGFYGDISADELEEKKDEGYTATSQIGKAGLESVLEEQLRGTNGGKVYIEDAEGNEKEVLADKEVVDGEDVNLTIRSDLQKTVYNQLKGDSGSSAAINPSTGEVYALVSSPSYDPNRFVLGISTERLTELQENPDRPMINKFTKTYAPGSTFKPITAAIGLKTESFNPAEEMSIPNKTYTQDGWGGYSVTRVDGATVDKQVTLRDALVRSDNIYFARAILEIGGEAFLQETKEFGFGEDIPFTYPVHSSQILNEDTFDSEVLLADTGYGQGQVEMSTLHLAMTYTPFVTNGTLLKPTIMKDEGAGQAWHENVISQETASTIREDLKAVVETPEGTGYEPQLSGINLAGKTGTAELKQSLEVKNGQENGWFVAWNTETNDLLLSMMIEDVEGGSHYVVPKVKKVFEQNME
ncbi:penicillin-binding transpeptidase domain-containing protein [Halobacillus sp. BBL2006]|uniref:penicillin-binding transpeptidase domain-containing protein n=1 Tax=Halobacillus sp. BBL2006 TaxID=1543706 RepID=UPI0005428B4C|nr:penicillin-binding transpeptidase domain-containing protein [Halobacillus sp. BBL2006]KHE73204.1 penicillin-binding protein 3 [Halobacillus sp. BBL2006]